MRRGRRRTTIGAQFSWRTLPMMESPAFRVLNLWEHRFLDRLEIELGHHGGTKNGSLTVTFQDFVDYGINRKAVSPSRRALEALGFIKVPKRGRGGNREYREASSYLITYKHTDNADPTDDWSRIKTTSEAEAVAATARAAKDPGAVARSVAYSKKQNPGGQIRTVSGAETHPENLNGSGVETSPSGPGVETHPTIYISGGDTEQPARDARPKAGASGRAATGGKPSKSGTVPSLILAPPGDPPEVIQNRVALRLGDARQGWLILQQLDPDVLQNLTDLENRGELSDAALEVVRDQYAGSGHRVTRHLKGSVA
jgi:hypothetical protein